jgi:hypothetical protein
MTVQQKASSPMVPKKARKVRRTDDVSDFIFNVGEGGI